jgi:hypothetical protein
MRPAARVALLAADLAELAAGLVRPADALADRRFAGAFRPLRLVDARGARVVDAVARRGDDVLATAVDPPRAC